MSATPTPSDSAGSTSLSDLAFTLDVLLRLLRTPSPTGFTEAAVRLIERELDALGVSSHRTKKGALTWEVPGTGEGHVAFSGHVDTLGAMVKEIKPSGRLRLAMLGGYDWATVEGEYAQVHTQAGGVVTGTVVNTHQSTHVHGPALRELKREQAVMEIRLDARTQSAEETRALGIEVGDFISFDPRAELTDAGYLKSRHLDNKAAVAVFLGVTHLLLQTPPRGPSPFTSPPTRRWATARPPAFLRTPTSSSRWTWRQWATVRRAASTTSPCAWPTAGGRMTTRWVTACAGRRGERGWSLRWTSTPTMPPTARQPGGRAATTRWP